MRELNPKELAIITKIKARQPFKYMNLHPGGLLVDYQHDGNFTMAFVGSGAQLNNVQVGVTKFNPFDSRKDDSIGEVKAFLRAVDKYTAQCDNV